jgi:hypothetical protein
MKNIILLVFSLFQLLSCKSPLSKRITVLNQADSTVLIENTLNFWKPYKFLTKEYFCIDIMVKSDGTYKSIELISNHVPDSVKAIAYNYIREVVSKNRFRFFCESSRYPVFCPLVVEVDKGTVNDILLWTGDAEGDLLLHYIGVQK